MTPPAGRPGARFRELLERERPLLLPGVVDALTARIASDVGFQAVYATGAGIANSQLGVPDLGLLAMPEMLWQVERIVASVGLPVIADIDTGYGNALNASRAVRAFERAGAAGVQIEDQVFPKQCGHFDGTQVVPVGEMLGRLAAAIDARSDPSFVIVARTDALASEGLEAAVSRARAYAQAGADILFIEAPTTAEVVASLPGQVAAPLLINLVEGGKTPITDRASLGEMGYRVVLYANTALRASALGAREALEALHRDGTSAAVSGRLLSWQDRQRLVGLDEHRRLADRYAGFEQEGGS